MSKLSPLDNLANNIVAGMSKVSSTETNKAQYDKSYKCIIIGVNRRFTKDISSDKQTELIQKYNIPEEVGDVNYYFFKINGIYYCLSSSASFKLYEEVNVRIPNNNWNKMFIETGGGENIISADTYTYILYSSGWEGATAPYTQEINVTWANESLHPIIDVILNNNFRVASEQRAQWTLVSDAYCGNRTLTFRCLGMKPTVNLNVIVKVI